MRLSLRYRLALLFFGINLVAIGALYLYVAPGLQTRLVNDTLSELAAHARTDSGPIIRTIGSAEPVSVLRTRVDAAALASRERVTVLVVSYALGAPQLSPEADSSKPGATPPLRFPIAYRAVSAGAPRTGTEGMRGATVAEAASPVRYQGRTGSVIVYSTSVSDIVRSVAVVRHEILVAGGIALILALLGGYLLTRALGRRVKRLERAAEQVAAGDFEHPIRIDSGDELGQLAVAFNEMQRQLGQLESARKNFIATASHELRTPIFSLGGFVELLEEEDLDPDTRRRFLEQVKQQVERLRKLSVDLLDLSRLEAGSLELRPELVDLAELTRAVSGEFEPTLVQHDAHLELRLAGRRIEALCDPVRLAQIMRILIDNALTHTPPGTRILVTAGQTDGHARLAVRDDGEGIDPVAVPRIFEPFYTADDAQGSGLGLAIASELAERMAGRLSVRSEPGETTFMLEIPA
ncbi:MAG: HAMP domain-containing histidine kinase [Solirubrobacterales bacterium]|nr:HAMP domain-containing histidine kinase [Solirubrobacterales bacterium]MBV9714323.1 HAMP domain-containing histidine kinase [Solirubrobacterales bacterium]